MVVQITQCHIRNYFTGDAQMQSSNHFRKAWMKGVISPIVYLYPYMVSFLDV
jgi:hypothetical protein